MKNLSTKKLNVVIAGPVCIDDNKTEGRHYVGWGSPAMYMATYLRRMHGVEPAVISAYGEDFLRYQDGVHLFPKNPQAIDTLQFRNIIASSHRRWEAKNTKSADPPELDEASLAVLRAADVFILGSILPNYSPGYVKQLVATLPEHCLKGIIAQGYLRNVDKDSKVTPRAFVEAKEILPLFDMVVMSTDDHPRSALMAAAWQKAKLAKAVVLTQGEKGATVFRGYSTPEHITTQPIADKDIVDSVGCGDVFAAELLYSARLNSHNIVQAVHTANEAARNKLLAAS